MGRDDKQNNNKNLLFDKFYATKISSAKAKNTRGGGVQGNFDNIQTEADFNPMMIPPNRKKYQIYKILAKKNLQNYATNF